MKFRDYLIRRSLQIIPTLIGLSILIFYITRVMPGDPIRLYLGLEATKEQVEYYRRLFGLDKPLYIQYIDYWVSLFTGKATLVSLYTGRSVVVDIVSYLPTTLELIIVSMIFSSIIGIALGVICAIYKNKFIDNILRVTAIAGVSFPRFWIGLILQLIIGYYLGILPIAGHYTPRTTVTGFVLLDSLITGDIASFFECIKYMILPVITLSFSPIAQIMRIVRASVIEEISKPYVATLRAHGFPENLLYYKYLLRQALVVAITIIGMLFGFFVYGGFEVEIVFGWPGLAWYTVQTALYKDFNGLVAAVMIIGIIMVVVNYVVDVVYSYLDPRIRIKMMEAK